MSQRLTSIEVLISPSQIGSTWLQQERLSTHMSKYPWHAASRSTWRGQHDRVFVRIHTDDGAVGVGATRGTSAAVIILEHLAGLLRGRELGEHEALYEELAASQLTYGWSGPAAAALSAIDLALWDLRATAEGVPLSRLLAGGQPVREQLPCYVTVHPERLSGAAGLAGVKLAARFGPEDGPDAPARVADDIASVREAVGPQTLVMIDSACSWTADFVDAMLSHLSDGQLDWLEDPLLPWDHTGYEAIKERVSGWAKAPKICLGNYAFSALEAQQVLTEGIVDVLQPDLTWVGGLTPALDLHQQAASRGVAFSPHYGAMHPWAVHLLAAIEQEELAEFVTTSTAAQRDDYPGLPLPHKGWQTVPPQSGAGADLSPDILTGAESQTIRLT
ncbi:MAG TPA: mandelate racemase/muconate lactonizing enzyme family protein [Beutenbergiaceae bacterium]|nr:mandelate racemase/muconate lactonizing enzyme family protein [Beutenbergiaceae bacterium]